ncbi:MAG: ATPase, T2SS/T4P/T4SS family [Acidobacteria bacterium]|nr:ATPase, T2SS/T4P/T4SS family [Acidobacteriota bacterium]
MGVSGAAGGELTLTSLRNVFPAIKDLIGDETVTEIMVVCARGGEVLVFFERRGVLHRLEARGAGRRDVERLIYSIARPLDVDPDVVPLGDGRLADGSRVALCLPPASLAPAVTIRRFSKVVMSGAELVAGGSLPQEVLDLLGATLAHGGNVLVAGGTGSGKTTLLNALIKMFPADRRIVVIEDMIELKVDQKNVLRLEARQLSAFQLTIRDMVRHALRQRPDHIVVGEIRGPEAQDVLQALNTGHGGSLTTIHANTTKDALSRLASCAMQAEDRLPWDVLCRGVASAFQLVVHQHRRPDGSRGVSELLRVHGYDAGSGEWKAKSLWRSEHAGGAAEAGPVLPPLASGVSAGGKAVAVRAGAKPGAGVVEVDPEDRRTVPRPAAPGLPSPAVTEQFGRRKVVSAPPVDGRLPDESDSGAASRVVGYPHGEPVSGAVDGGSG